MYLPRSLLRLSLATFLALKLVAAATAASLPWPNDTTLHFELPAQEGERYHLAKIDAWVPSDGAPVRAVIIHQHGCGDGSANAAATFILDQHWRAFARSTHCALLAPQFLAGANCADWNAPGSGSERALFSALDEISRRSGHTEIKTIPWILWGHSGGASWAVQMVVRHPDRVIALALRGGAGNQFGDPAFRAEFSRAAHDLPMLFVWGRGEAAPESSHSVSWAPMHTMAEKLRQAGAKLAVAIDPLTEHHCGNSRLVALPFFAAVLESRASSAPLSGVWVRHRDAGTVAATADERVDPNYAWLPTREVADAYQAFEATGWVSHVRPIRRAPELRGVIEKGHPSLTWQIEPEIDSGLRSIRLYRNGTLLKEFGGGPAEFVAEHNDTPSPELRLTRFSDGSAQPGFTYDYELSFVNSVGAESPRSAHAILAVAYPSISR